MAKSNQKYDAHFEIYPDSAGQFRWRVRAENGQPTGSSHESFDSEANADRAAKAFAKSIRGMKRICIKRVAE